MREITMKALLSKFLDRFISGIKAFRMAVTYAKVTLLPFAFIAFMSFAQCTQAQPATNCKISHVIKSMPDIKSVYDKFYQTYSYNSAERLPNILKFARKKDGWWVYEEDGINGGQPFQQQLFWSYAKKAYQKLDFSEFKDGDNSNAEADFGYYMAGQLYDYSRIPYYGYNGWANDVVNEMQHEQNLGDTLLEALARAYGELGDIRGGRNYTHNYDATMKTLDDSIAYYLSNVDKELSTYKRLIEQNPDYKTMVGNVFIKYSHEYVNTWMELCMYGRPDLAKKYLPAGLYGSTYTDISKNYLNSCAKDAILFTNGDGDTYPLWYAQEALGIRKDVTVINSTLLAIPSYTKAIQGHLGSSASVIVGMPYSAYSSKRLGYLFYDKSDKFNVFELAEAIKSIVNNVRQKDEAGAEYREALQFSAADLYFRVSGKGSALYRDLNEQDKTTDSIFFKPGRYLLKSDILLLDIISNNANNRPICFSYAAGFEEYLGIGPYLRLEGMVYRLVASSTYSPNGGIALHKEILYNTLMNKFGFALSNTKPEKTFTNYDREAENVRAIFLNAAAEYDRNNAKEKVTKLLDRMEAIVPHGKLAYRKWDIPVLLDINIKMKQKDQIQLLLKDLSGKVEEGTKNIDYTTPNGKNEINEAVYLLNSCIKICTEGGYKTETTAISAQLKKLKTKYDLKD